MARSHKMTPKTNMNADHLRKILYYDPQTGIFSWKENRCRAQIGNTAGHIAKNGYVTIRVDGCMYYAHRLAWLYVYGEWPELSIDHSDGNPSNNAINNLRLATQSQNLYNARARPRSDGSIKGVCYCATKKKWIAYINGKNIGTFENFNEAIKSRLAAATELHGKFMRP